MYSCYAHGEALCLAQNPISRTILCAVRRSIKLAGLSQTTLQNANGVASIVLTMVPHGMIIEFCVSAIRYTHARYSTNVYSINLGGALE